MGLGGECAVCVGIAVILAKTLLDPWTRRGMPLSWPVQMIELHFSVCVSISPEACHTCCSDPIPVQHQTKDDDELPKQLRTSDRV